MSCCFAHLAFRVSGEATEVMVFVVEGTSVACGSRRTLYPTVARNG